MIQLAVAAAVAAALLAAGFFAGVKVESNSRDASELASRKEGDRLRQVEESRLDGVSVAYQSVASQLKRIESSNRTEVIREIQKIEYRCPVPDVGRVQYNATVDALNAARGREPAPAVPAAAEDGRR
jgi:outer membrane murein-binding lipoprotein Lpp